MWLGIIGGKLQGTEACYLAHKAGYQILLIDHNRNCQAADLADRFICADILEDRDKYEHALSQVDAILPAIEDIDVLNQMKLFAEQCEVPYLHDTNAYDISSSKQRTYDKLSEWGVPIPTEYPQCGMPVFVKPLYGSGSHGTRIITNELELTSFFIHNARTKYRVEQYLAGPSYSIEVIGDGTNFKIYQITEVCIDKGYDCNRINAPAQISEIIRKKMDDMATRIGKNLQIYGIFDIEVIQYTDTDLVVLEIDARLPSQTPISVYWSTGINFLEELLSITDTKKSLRELPQYHRNVIYQHIKVSHAAKGQTLIEMPGEHSLAMGGKLHVEKNFFGADEAITNYAPGKREWVAALIVTSELGAEGVQRKLNKILQAIEQEGVELYDEVG